MATRLPVTWTCLGSSSTSGNALVLLRLDDNSGACRFAWPSRGRRGGRSVWCAMAWVSGLASRKAVNIHRSRPVETDCVVLCTDFPLPSIQGRRMQALCLSAAMTCACVLLAPTQPLAQQPGTAQAQVPVADFFRTPLLAKPAMSPSGRYLAGAVAAEGKRAQLIVLDLENLGQSKLVAGFEDADINSYEWVNDERIVFDVIDRQSGTSRPLAPGLWAVNRDGGDFRQLVNASRTFTSGRASHLADHRLPWEWRLHSVLADGSSDVLVQGLTFNSRWEVVDTKLARLDTTTGRIKNLSEGAPDHVTRWVVDRQGRPAVVTTWHEGRFRAYVKSDADTGWEKWQDADGFSGSYVVPYWIGFDGQLLVLGRRADDTLALYAIDAKTRQLEAGADDQSQGLRFRGRRGLRHAGAAPAGCALRDRCPRHRLAGSPDARPPRPR